MRIPTICSGFMFRLFFILYLKVVCVVTNSFVSRSNFVDHTIEIKEDEKVGTIVKDIRDTINYPSASFAIIGLEVLKYFTLDPKTGIIKINRSLDLENPSICSNNPDCCVHKKRCIFTFYLQINQEGIKPVPQKFYIIIKDVNDWAPEFPLKTINVTFKEGLDSISTIKPLMQATDKDFNEENRVKSYYLKPEYASTFQLIQRDSKLNLKLLKELDREEQTSYRFRLIAVDGGGREGSTEINVIVDDKNEHTPVFFSDTVTHFDISESEQPGKVITKLQAKDKDASPNNKITYGLDPANNAQIMETFFVNPLTGKLSIKRHLDFETIQEYKFYVIATDSDYDDPRTASIMITVRVHDANDNKPSILLIGAPGEVAYIDENDREGTIVASIHVTDQDKGEFGMVKCDLTASGNDFTLMAHDEELFYLETRRSFDRETKGFYYVKIRCQDHGKQKQYSEKTLKVIIRDKNDEIPVFTRNIYNFEIQENSPIGYPLIPVGSSPATVVANDRDINDTVTYSLERGTDTHDYQLFQLLKNGTIVNNGHLDREARQSMTFKVSAYDGKHRATADIFVNILDVNDNNPEFDQNIYVVKILENQSRLDPLITFRAIDKDKDNEAINYVLDYEGNDLARKHFFLRKNQLYLNNKLDREEKADYHLKVRIEDVHRGYASRTSTASIYVNVIDINDNVPRFIFPNSTNNATNISCLESAGSRLVTVVAVDPDEGINGTVNYTLIAISPHDVRDLFHLDGTRGDILLAKNDLRNYCGNIFYLTLKAEDIGDPMDHSSGRRVPSVEVLRLNLLNVPPKSYAAHSVLPPRVVLCIILGTTTIFLVCLVVAYLFLLYYKKRRRGSPHGSRKEGDTLSCVVAFTREKEVVCPTFQDIYAEHLIDAMVEYEGACSDVTTQSRMTPSHKHYSPDADSAYCDLSSRDSWRIGSVDTQKGRTVLRSGSDYSKNHQSGKFLTSIKAQTSSSLARIAQRSPTPTAHLRQETQALRPFFTPQLSRKASAGKNPQDTRQQSHYQCTTTSAALEKQRSASSSKRRRSKGERQVAARAGSDRAALNLATLPILHCRVPTKAAAAADRSATFSAATVRDRSACRVRCSTDDYPLEDVYTMLVHEQQGKRKPCSLNSSGPSAADAESKSATYISLPQVHTTFV